MSYTPTEWKDRIVERPRTYQVQNNPDGTITLTPKPGTVIEEGTPVNAANLNKLEQGFSAHLEETATLSASGHIQSGMLAATLDTNWSGTEAPFTKTQSISGILATDTPIVDVVLSGTYSTDEARLEAWGQIYRITTANDSITLYATEKPSVNLPIQLKVVR